MILVELLAFAKYYSLHSIKEDLAMALEHLGDVEVYAILQDSKPETYHISLRVISKKPNLEKVRQALERYTNYYQDLKVLDICEGAPKKQKSWQAFAPSMQAEQIGYFG